jgi:hypothetical protein
MNLTNTIDPSVKIMALDFGGVVAGLPAYISRVRIYRLAMTRFDGIDLALHSFSIISSM